jgi:hypothetical protein
MSLPLRPLRSILPIALLAVPSLAASGCVAPTSAARGIALDDPLGLVMDVASSGNPLRVYVLPTSSYACQASVGTISPDIPDVEPGMVPDAVVDISADVSGDMASAMAVIPTGDWTVLVRGRGVDPVSGRRGIIATGCATVAGLAPNETRAVNITLLPHHDSGMCNDMIVSPDEQCDPSASPMVSDCDSSCHTMPRMVDVNPAVTGNKTSASISSATGQRIAVAFYARDLGSPGIRLFDQNGNQVGTTGMSLAQDETIDNLSMPVPQTQGGGVTAMGPDGHFAIAFTDFGPAQSDVLVQFLDANRTPTATSNARATPTGTQQNPQAAYAGNGALMVVYEDTMSTTGISGSVFASGSTTPTTISLGTGASGATHPAVTGTPTGFVVAFASATDVWFQRYASDGTPTDAMPQAVLAAADATDTQDEPAIAAQSDGSFVVAWTEHSIANGDGMGTSIRARTFAAAGTATGAAVVLPSLGIAGDQTAPAAAAADMRFLVAWTSGSSVHARIVSSMGAPLPNREQPQTTDDFVVAAAGAAPSACAMGTTPASWMIAYDNGGHIFTRRYPR